MIGDVVAARISLIFQISEGVYTIGRLLRKSKGKCIAFSIEQKLWLVKHGIIPYNTNDIDGALHYL